MGLIARVLFIYFYLELQGLLRNPQIGTRENKRRNKTKHGSCINTVSNFIFFVLLISLFQL